MKGDAREVAEEKARERREKNCIHDFHLINHEEARCDRCGAYEF